MTSTRGSLRLPLLAFVALILIALVAIPAMAAAPSGVPGAAAASDKPGKGPKASKEPETPVTVRGVVGTRTDADGDLEYTITVDGKVLGLDAGPSWFHGDKHPLKDLVGKTVTVAGGQRGDKVDVETVDGARIRAEGKPPWAGGWKAVGSAHPGWTQEKADRWMEKHGAKAGANGSADCWPPGHCKDPEPAESESPVGT
jgi:hypothetical protein